VDWLPLATAERRGRRPTVAVSIAAGVRESVEAGVCVIGEIATAEPAAYEFDAPVWLTPFLEVIGFSRARADSVFAALLERIAAMPLGANLGVSPHAPYTVSPALLRRIVELACERHLPVTMHLAECGDEREFLDSGTGPFQRFLDELSMWDPDAIPRGSRPLDYLRMLVDAPRALVIHGNFLGREEHDFLAAHAERMTLVYCPRTHVFFGHPPYPLAELLAAGVRVALGTDSRASNPDLSVWNEMRHVARTHPEVSPESILQMGTLAAAQALGVDSDVGSITPGKLANLVAIPLPAGSLAELLAAAGKPATIWLRGREI
jgi:cytosine/adenosine deaminase-related metal-dependent hydrolase